MESPEENQARPLDWTLVWLIAVNAAMLVAANAAGAKMIQLPLGLAASATVIPYAASFAFTDLISELYGPRAGRIAVRIAFVGLALSVLVFWGSLKAPPAGFWENQEAYEKTLGLAPRILLGGWTSYLISQHLDVALFHKIREATEGRHLWLRNNASTLVSQLVDTVIFMTIAFGGLFPLLPAIVGQYAVKLLIAAVDTPLVYLGVKLLGQREAEGAVNS